jgi:hypothetical protein
MFLHRTQPLYEHLVSLLDKTTNKGSRAFTATNINKVFSGYGPCQFAEDHTRFRPTNTRIMTAKISDGGDRNGP